MSKDNNPDSNLLRAHESFTEGLLKEVNVVKPVHNEKEQEQQASEDLDINYVKNFATEVKEAGFPKVKGKRAQQILEVFAHKLDQYQKDLEDLSKEDVAVDESNLSAEEKLKIEEKRKKRQEKIEQIANEVFIISCASNLAMEKSIEFCKECNLGKDINKFGENGFSALAAAKLAEKGEADLNQLKENGADENARDMFGRSAQDIVNSIQKFDSKDIDLEESQGFEGRERAFTARRKSLTKKSENSKSKNGGEDSEIGDESQARSELIEYLDGLKKKVGKRKSGLFGSDSDEDEQNNSGLTDAEFQMLKKMGIDPNDRLALDRELFQAVRSGNATLPLLLVKLGADVNYRENGLTVLGAALISGSETLIPILVYLSTPETRKSTLEVNRAFVDRLEDKIDALGSMVDSMGQNDINEYFKEKSQTIAKEETELLVKKEHEEKEKIEKAKHDAQEEELSADYVRLLQERKENEERREKEKEKEKDSRNEEYFDDEDTSLIGGIILTLAAGAVRAMQATDNDEEIESDFQERVEDSKSKSSQSSIVGSFTKRVSSKSGSNDNELQ
jgi:hypothetical protein